jgi:hypothetical protein
MAEQDIQRAALYATDEEIKEAWDVWARYHVCARCGVYYNAFAAFGARGCSQHAQSVSVVTRDDGRRQEIFKCCKRRVPLPSFNHYPAVGAGVAVLDSFSHSYAADYDRPGASREPPGCCEADHTPVLGTWDTGQVEIESKMVKVSDKWLPLRPSGGWPLESKCIVQQEDGPETQGTVKSVPDAYGKIRVDQDTVDGFRLRLVGDIDESKTYEVVNEKGSCEDKVSYVGGIWRSWKRGVAIADIAGIMPYMMQDVEHFTIDDKGAQPFMERTGIAGNSVPVVWRADPRSTHAR